MALRRRWWSRLEPVLTLFLIPNEHEGLQESHAHFTEAHLPEDLAKALSGLRPYTRRILWKHSNDLKLDCMQLSAAPLDKCNSGYRKRTNGWRMLRY